MQLAKVKFSIQTKGAVMQSTGTLTKPEQFPPTSAHTGTNTPNGKKLSSNGIFQSKQLIYYFLPYFINVL